MMVKKKFFNRKHGDSFLVSKNYLEVFTDHPWWGEKFGGRPLRSDPQRLVIDVGEIHLPDDREDIGLALGGDVRVSVDVQQPMEQREARHPPGGHVAVSACV
jgi:hypothetical protein